MEHKAKEDRTKDPWNDGEPPVPCSEDSDGELHESCVEGMTFNAINDDTDDDFHKQ